MPGLNVTANEIAKFLRNQVNDFCVGIFPVEGFYRLA
ncbi:MAG: hypothetical protein CM1200mP15_01220 [Dehalococcoidia bacterium]|nr:MAG: hypothetical protein CM1200mP15_01220 [Dehalococcoidia bacterium]